MFDKNLKKDIHDIKLQIASLNTQIQDMNCKHDGNYWFIRDKDTFKKQCSMCKKIINITMEEYYELRVHEAKNIIKDAQEELEDLKKEIEEYAKSSVESKK
jgi:hypothetical protein